MPTLEELKTRFQSDRFAVEVLGAEIRQAEPGCALCALGLRPEHMNANHTPMGGAIFTLADFAFAVAANGFAEQVTVSQAVSITFLAPARGRELLARARCLKAGRTTCLYAVEVRDELGTYVAHGTVNGFTLAPRTAGPETFPDAPVGNDARVNGLEVAGDIPGCGGGAGRSTASYAQG